MARRRMIDPSIWDDEGVGLLSDSAFKLFISCVSFADDEGKLPGSACQLRANAFRFARMSVTRVENLLREIESAIRGFVRYQVDGREYIKLTNWLRYQRVDKPQRSLIPEPFQDRSENDTGMVPDRSSHEEKVSTREEKVREEKVSEGADAPHPLLTLLQSIPGYPSNGSDSTWLSELESDFAALNLRRVLTNIRDWDPAARKPQWKAYRIAIRRWCTRDLEEVKAKPNPRSEVPF